MTPHPTAADPSHWPQHREALLAEQELLAAARPAPWRPVGVPLLGCAALVDDGGARAWVGAVLSRGPTTVAEHAIEGSTSAPYRAGLLALREGPLLAAALAALPQRPDVLLLPAAGRDHPEGAGLALHLGAVLDLPSVGVTDVPLRADGPDPGRSRGDSAPLRLAGVEVARRVRTVDGVRPVVAHAGWRTDPDVAAEVVLGCTAGARTPGPLRAARRLARASRRAALSP